MSLGEVDSIINPKSNDGKSDSIEYISPVPPNGLGFATT